MTLGKGICEFITNAKMLLSSVSVCFEEMNAFNRLVHPRALGFRAKIRLVFIHRVEAKGF